MRLAKTIPASLLLALDTASLSTAALFCWHLLLTLVAGALLAHTLFLTTPVGCDAATRAWIAAAAPGGPVGRAPCRRPARPRRRAAGPRRSPFPVRDKTAMCTSYFDPRPMNPGVCFSPKKRKD